jgi:hypothetical protein
MIVQPRTSKLYLLEQARHVVLDEQEIQPSIVVLHYLHAPFYIKYPVAQRLQAFAFLQIRHPVIFEHL